MVWRLSGMSMVLVVDLSEQEDKPWEILSWHRGSDETRDLGEWKDQYKYWENIMQFVKP